MIGPSQIPGEWQDVAETAGIAAVRAMLERGYARGGYAPDALLRRFRYENHREACECQECKETSTASALGAVARKGVQCL